MPRAETYDEVVRRIRFSEAHPEVHFSYRYETGIWEACYRDGENSVKTIFGHKLGDVLNELEQHLS